MCCRFRLPKTLPPSFKGVAARYLYHVEATARFAVPKGLGSLPSIPLSSSASVLGDSIEALSAAAAASHSDNHGAVSTSAGTLTNCLPRLMSMAALRSLQLD